MTTMQGRRTIRELMLSAVLVTLFVSFPVSLVHVG